MKPQKTLQYQLFFLEYMLKSSWFLLSILRSQDRVSDVATQICLDPFISFCTRDMICISWRPAMKQEKRSETFLGISQWRSWPVASAVSTARHLHSPRKHEASKCSAIFTFEENLRCIVRIVGLPSIQRESPKRTDGLCTCPPNWIGFRLSRLFHGHQYPQLCFPTFPPANNGKCFINNLSMLHGWGVLTLHLSVSLFELKDSGFFSRGFGQNLTTCCKQSMTLCPVPSCVMGFLCWTRVRSRGWKREKNHMTLRLGQCVTVQLSDCRKERSKREVRETSSFALHGSRLL